MTVQIVLDTTPPSLNTVGSRGGWRRFRDAKKGLQTDIERLLMAEGVPRGFTAARVAATLRFPSRRGRDEINFRALLDKATGDALVNGGWLPDDGPAHYEMSRLEFDPERGAPRTTLTIEFLDEVLR